MNHMRKSGAMIALLSTGLLVLASVTPAGAAAGTASGTVTWRASSWPVGYTGTSTFAVTDGVPGFSGRPSKPAASRGDTGSYTLSRLDGSQMPAGSLRLDVTCVRVDASGWAEFAGSVTEATGVYVVGEVFLVSVKDGGPGGVDEIGMKSHGLLSLDPNALKKGCNAALDDKQFGRQGVISAGDIAVD